MYQVCFNEAIAEAVAVVYEEVEKRGTYDKFSLNRLLLKMV